MQGRPESEWLLRLADFFKPTLITSSVNKPILKRLVWPLLIAGLSSCYHPGKVVYQDSHVTALHSDAFLSSINVHGGERMSLRVGGIVYKNVRGAKPYYLDVPELSAIVFVTEESESKATLHLVSNSNGKHLAIAIGGCDFGNFTGRDIQGGKAGAPGSNYIEFIGADTIRLVTRGYNWRSALKVNLKTKKTENEESVQFDDSGAIKSRFLDGKRLQ